MLIAAATLLALQIAAADVPIGVAAASADGHVCVAMLRPVLAPGATLTLVRPDSPQAVLVVTIVQPAPGCEPLERALVPGPYYLASRPTATAADSTTLWVALSGRGGTRDTGDGTIVTQLSPAYPDAQVRSCTSQEGLHLTMWSGVPLTSQRLWHQYYYLGYDVEPSCDDRDVAETAG